jgi:AcrR family transcriptional regulator
VTYQRVGERRRQLVAVARKVLTERGTGATSTRTLAAEAGVPLSTLHYVFGSRDELWRAVLEDVTADLSALVRRSIGPGMSFAEAVEATYRDFWASIEHCPEQELMSLELFVDARRRDSGRDLARWQYERYAADCAEAFTAVLEHSQERLAQPLGDVVSLMLALSDGMIIQYLADGDRERSHRLLEHAIDAVVRFAAPEKEVPAHRVRALREVRQP